MELFAGEGNLFSEIKSKGHVGIAMDILYAPSFRDLLADKKSNPFDILSTSGLAFFVIYMESLVLKKNITQRH